MIVILAVLVLGLLAGFLVAALSSVATLGGWLLVLLGVGMVVVMGAFEAGYLDGPRARLREYFTAGRRPPSS